MKKVPSMFINNSYSAINLIQKEEQEKQQERINKQSVSSDNVVQELNIKKIFLNVTNQLKVTQQITIRTKWLKSQKPNEEFVNAQVNQLIKNASFNK